jgi:hypothetical protein
MVDMAQYTLRQLLLAMTCFAIAFAGVSMRQSALHEGNWEWLAGAFLILLGVISGIGAMRGYFLHYLVLAIIAPLVLVLIPLMFLALGWAIECIWAIIH